MLSASCFITIVPVDNPTATLLLAKQARTTLMVILVTVLFLQDYIIGFSPFYGPFSLFPPRDPKNEGQDKVQWTQVSLRTFLLDTF